ncbi:hypothetical protein [Methylococcus mesophilus]|uniref:hypothetical protein n=1 Tax=Methylococcus mesophilus TaxID=2993564 RepID=UPI00224A986A|nr:hypothetical protein [Methylococcus mesophilus]UZR28045.1 hypothetical protein OOT43_15195 [Methylococcus mesophilus]UZR28130.1 hypothetical protein OOT43_15630 [Methylococcus mesophilus]
MAKKDRGIIIGKPRTVSLPQPAGGVQLETFLPWTLVKRGLKREILTPLGTPAAFQEEAKREVEKRRGEQDTPLIRALGLAHYWQRLLDEGKFESLSELAAAEGIDIAQVSRIARLVRLAPGIVEACVAEMAPVLTLEDLNRRAKSVHWDVRQRV